MTDIRPQSSVLSPQASTSVDAANPWPGLASFTEEQGAFFHGRSEEIHDLTRLAERRALTILFGQSGLGKSSLLQAGVFPRLRTAGFCPIYIRLDHSETAPTPTAQVQAMVRAETARAGTWSKPGVAKVGESLWEFFHHRDDRLIEVSGRVIVPVLVFDQFEELFTLGAAGGARRDRAVAFMSELAELVENRPSEKLVARLEESADEMDAFDFGRTDYRVVISLREDYLPHLETLKTIMPALMENRMRLAQMTGTQALEAVLKPGAGLVDDDVARAIIEFVAGARGGSAERLAELHVEPPLLSVICRELNERRKAKGQARITMDQVVGDRREILNHFYERSVADLPEAMRHFVEDRLLTKSGFRDNLSLETALEGTGVTRELIDTLVSRRLLQLEDRLGQQRVELSHDVLAEVIRASRDAHQQRLALEASKERARSANRRVRRLSWLVAAMGVALALLAVGTFAFRSARDTARSAQAQAVASQQQAVAAQEKAVAKEQETQAVNASLRLSTYVAEMNVAQQALNDGNLQRAIATLNRHVPAPGEKDLRGFEWRYLWEQAHPARSTIIGEFDGIFLGHNLVFSPDGSLLASSRADSSIEIRDWRTKAIIRTLPNAGRRFTAFSPDGRWLLSTSGPAAATSKIHRWNVQTWQEESFPDGLRHPFVFARGGDVLVAREGNHFSVWRTDTWRKVQDLPGIVTFATTVGVSGIAVSPDGKRVFFGGSPDGEIRSWDLNRNEELPPMPISFGAVATSLAVSPDGLLAAAHYNGRVTLWDIATSRLLHTFEGHKSWAGAVAFSPDGSMLVSSSGDMTVQVYDPKEHTVVDRLIGHQYEVWGVAFSPDGRSLVTGGYFTDPSLRVWPTDQIGNKVRPFHADALLGFADEGKSIVGWSRGAGYRVYTLATGVERPLLPALPFLTGAGWRKMAFSPDLKFLALLVNGAVEVRSVTSGEVVRRLEHQDGTIADVAISPDGRYLVTAGTKEARRWRISDWSSVRLAELPAGSNGISFSGNSRFVAVRAGVPDRRILVFDLERGGAPVELTGVQMTIVSGAAGSAIPFVLSADGSRVSLGSYGAAAGVNLGNVAIVADVKSPPRTPTYLRGHLGAVIGTAFSPDGRTLATVGGDNFIKLWSLDTMQELLNLPGVQTSTSQAMFSPDGIWLVTLSDAGDVRLFHAPTFAEIEAVERAAAARPAASLDPSALEPGP